mgnify:FL=1
MRIIKLKEMRSLLDFFPDRNTVSFPLQEEACLSGGATAVHQVRARDGSTERVLFTSPAASDFAGLNAAGTSGE